MAWTHPPLKRSYACNEDLLLYLRERKGWTQSELALKAGYSERLINKAEAGKSISTTTIDILAEALSTAEETIYPEDLICDAVALAKEFMAGFYIHKINMFNALHHFLDEEMVLKFAGDPEKIPFAGTYRGLAELQRFADIFYSILEVPAGHNHEPWYQYFAQGNDVIVWGESWIHPIGTPMEKPMKMSNHLKFCKGKLILFEDVFDTQHGEEVVGKFLEKKNGQARPPV